MSTTTLIDLLRHGETQGGTRFRGSTNDPLTDAGWAQLWAATKVYKSGWDYIITSPLSRCADFAQYLGEKYSIPVIRDERFQELHFGRWEGRTTEELMQTDAEALSRFWANPISNPPPQAEPLRDFEQRVLSGWHDIVARHQGKHLLLVNHGGVIRLLLCHILARPLTRLLDIEVGHAALHHIRVEHQHPHKDTAFIESQYD